VPTRSQSERTRQAAKSINIAPAILLNVSGFRDQTNAGDSREGADPCINEARLTEAAEVENM
jgi:hypothetical protein